jgi:hypothetical protein
MYQADLVRRQQELQGDAHLTLKNLCLEVIISSVRVWWIPPQKIFWKKPTMESRARLMSLRDSRIASRATGEDAGASQLKICRGGSELGKAITNSTYKMAYAIFSKRKLCKMILLIVDFFLECAWVPISLSGGKKYKRSYKR